MTYSQSSFNFLPSNHKTNTSCAHQFVTSFVVSFAHWNFSVLENKIVKIVLNRRTADVFKTYIVERWLFFPPLWPVFSTVKGIFCTKLLETFANSFRPATNQKTSGDQTFDKRLYFLFQDRTQSSQLFGTKRLVDRWTIKRLRSSLPATAPKCLFVFLSIMQCLPPPPKLPTSQLLLVFLVCSIDVMNLREVLQQCPACSSAVCRGEGERHMFNTMMRTTMSEWLIKGLCFQLRGRSNVLTIPW